MDKITELHLRHFQPHTDRQLPISDITVLAGRSDAGKSSILRAIRWLCLNSGSPSTYIQRGKSNVAVTIKIGGVSADTPHIIIRQNSGKKNGYLLDGQEFNAIGKDIPPEVLAILNFIPDNFQTQHDYLYWFLDTGSALVKRIESTFGLAESAEWAATAKLEATRLEKEVKDFDNQITTINREIDSLSIYRRFEEEYRRLETLTSQFAKKQDAHTRLFTLAQAIRPVPRLVDDSALTRSEYHLAIKSKAQRLASFFAQYPPALPFVDSSWISKTETHLLAKEKARRLHFLESQYPSVVLIVDPSNCVQRLENHLAHKTKATRLYQLAITHQSHLLPVIDASPSFLRAENLINSKARAIRLKELYDQYTALSMQSSSLTSSYNETEALLVSLTGQPCPTCGKPL